jgi:hypothetical protein
MQKAGRVLCKEAKSARPFDQRINDEQIRLLNRSQKIASDLQISNVDQGSLRSSAMRKFSRVTRFARDAGDHTAFG